MRLSKFGKLKKIKGVRELKSKFSTLPDLKFENLPVDYTTILEGALDIEDPRVREVLSVLGNRSGDYDLAVRLVKLQAQFPNSSLPELVTFDWLSGQQLRFFYQAQLFGGRAFRGGLLPDFVVESGGGGAAWQVQGEYWHSQGINQGKDAMANRLLLGQQVNGVRIGQVVELWENDIYHKRPQIFFMALGGIGMRG